VWKFGESANVARRERVSTFCDQLAVTPKKLELVSKAGHPTTPLAREAFLNNTIGIAKRWKVLPSSRAPRKPGSWQPLATLRAAERPKPQVAALPEAGSPDDDARVCWCAQKLNPSARAPRASQLIISAEICCWAPERKAIWSSTIEGLRIPDTSV
jgi:hypothetical protein